MQPPHPSIPAEALARQARLQEALRAMEVGPSREPACLQNLRAMVLGWPAADVELWFRTIAAEDVVEEAAERLRACRREAVDRDRLAALTARLAPLAEKAQRRRAARWQLDTRRALIRFVFAKEDGAIGFDDGDLHAILLQALRLEGLRLALDLGKRPRPLLGPGLPLPAGVGGVAESMDAVLTQEPQEAPADLMARLNRRLPPGLSIHQWAALPAYASPAADLAIFSHWAWKIPPERVLLVRERTTRFLEADTWPWERGASRSEGALDLRTFISRLHIDGDGLRFTTEMGHHQATNPLKVLGAILGLDPAGIAGLVRLGVELRPDSRLDHAEKFQPKLKNMYEDAVLLGGASNIVLVDEDDDEPIRLG